MRLDLKLFEKDAMENLHWDLETVESQEYERLMEVLSANKDDRMVSPEEMAEQWASLN